MTTFRRGEVVLVEFVFSDESGAKRRPALVISTSAYHRARQEVIVAAITRRVDRRLFGDYLIADWQRAGLLSPSLVTGILRTIKQTMVRRTLGSLTEGDLDAYGRVLRRSVGLVTDRSPTGPAPPPN
jgi:mRNA interferase MazF